jgi:hypothetical protein
MAQYGTTACFLSNDNAYSLTPNGLTPIGNNIANLLENQTYTEVNPSIWEWGAYPNAGLYGSIVVMEGELHYLLCASSAGVIGTSATADTQVLDYNMANTSWNLWEYPGYTATCPIVQSVDNQIMPIHLSSRTYIANDNWLLVGWYAGSSGIAYVHQMLTVNQLMQMTGLGNLGTQIFAPTLSVQFRTESPAVARLLQERRIAFEYENLEQISTSLNLNWILYGQQDPTAVTNSTGPALNTTSLFTSSVNYLPFSTTGLLSRQVFGWQQDFGTWAGTCTSLNLSTSNPVSLVKITQVSTLPKVEIT